MENQKQLFKLANVGIAEAQCRLAEAYYYGYAGLNTDEQEAVYWYTKAAEQGHKLATVCLNKIMRKLSNPKYWKTATVDNVKQKIADGANVNARDAWNITPLMLAGAFTNNPDIIKALVDAGADVNARSRGGNTALMAAIWHKNTPEVIKTLKEAGAK